MFELHLHLGDHVRRYSIRADAKAGWEIQVQRDERVDLLKCHDWHRVERAIRVFETEASHLITTGWRVDRPSMSR